MRNDTQRKNKINWQKLWQDKLNKKTDRKKDWDKAAPKFHKSAKRDDYHKLLLKQLNIKPTDTILDLGCGEGTITIPLSKISKHITGLDSSKKMLELLNEKCEKQDINNINTIEMDIEEIKYENLGEYDIVIASRSLNNILNINEIISEINKIAQKSVYITLFGPNNWRIEREFYEWINKPYADFPTHDYFFNILFNLGIYSNVKNLDIGKPREYDSINDAIESGKWRTDSLSDEELKLLKEYLNKVMVKDENTGKYSSVSDRADWVLFWWNKIK